jgi:HEAT repeat protein
MYKSRHLPKAALCLPAIALVMAMTIRGASAQEEFENWHLESGVGQAHLVMVARVASISQVTIVEGAKTDVALREFRFEPVRRLKGIFARDQLSMTADDLGISAGDASNAPPLNEGEFRLLILVQQQGLESYGCVSAAPGATTIDERVPLLSGPDDPLVGVVETLIKVADSQSRRERAKLLVDRLADVGGVAAVPLLSSLRLRADWAAADGRAYTALARLARDQATPVRGGALETLRDMMATRAFPNDPKQLDAVAESLREVLRSDEGISRIQLAALESLAHFLTLKADLDWARELLTAQLNDAATYAERAAAATALSRIAHPQAAKAVLDAFAGLPLDESPMRESAYARAAVKVDAAEAERVLLARLKRSFAARESLAAEIEWLGRMRSKESLSLLLAAADQLNLAIDDRRQLAWALGRLGDDRAVPVLAGWLRSNDYQVKEIALASLENLDSAMAAREARSLLKPEGHLPSKLRLARLLARHGVADGYALATEHLADVGHTSSAALVLAALDDPRTSKDLSAILAARPDRRWHGAALAGLAAIDDAAARKQLLEILANDRHALAADAAEAAGLGADAEFLAPLAKLMQSRNKRIAMASLTALRRFLSGVRASARGLAAVDRNIRDEDATEQDDNGALAPAADIPAATRAAIAESAASLVLDAYVEGDLRHEAFAVARLLGGERFVTLLSELADQAELEGTPLLAAVQAERRWANRAVKQP